MNYHSRKPCRFGILQACLICISALQQALCAEANEYGNSVQATNNSSRPNRAYARSPSAGGTKAQAALITSKKENTSVNCTFGQVKVKSGSVVYASDNGQIPAVYNLYSVSDGVKVVLRNNESITVPLGRELLVTRSSSGSFEQIQPHNHISYRNTAELNVGNGIKIFTADFSVPSAILAIPLLHAKVDSTKPDDRKVADAVLKSAAMQSAVTTYRGPFKPGQ